MIILGLMILDRIKMIFTVTRVKRWTMIASLMQCIHLARGRDRSVIKTSVLGLDQWDPDDRFRKTFEK